MESPICTMKVEHVQDSGSSRAGRDAFRRNMRWLQEHWGDLLPAARGKYVAVAEQEALIADTMAEAARWAREQHPRDPGPLLEYVPTKEGSRIYATSG